MTPCSRLSDARRALSHLEVQTAKSPKALEYMTSQRLGAVGLKNAAFWSVPAIRGEQIGGAHMRIDLYTKTILTLIAVLLAVFTLKPILQPQAVMAQGAFAGIQFGYNGGNHAFFNTNTGDVWEYGDHGNFRNHYKVRELGKDHGR
jgi:hypothetical protein